MASTTGASPQPDTDSRRVVLFVEDEILIRWPFAEHLREVGLTVIEAATAAEAMAVLESRVPVHLVFTDIQLPGAMDGLMLARWIAAHRADVPVLLTSGAAGGAVGDYVSAGRFVTKPYAFGAAEARIRALLGAG